MKKQKRKIPGGEKRSGQERRKGIEKRVLGDRRKAIDRRLEAEKKKAKKPKAAAPVKTFTEKKQSTKLLDKNLARFDKTCICQLCGSKEDPRPIFGFLFYPL